MNTISEQEKIKYAKELVKTYEGIEIFSFPGGHHIKHLMDIAGENPVRTYYQGSGELGWDCAGIVYVYKGRLAGIVKSAQILSERVNNKWRMSFDAVVTELI